MIPIRDPDEILSDVAKNGTSRSDWTCLYNVWFREGGQQALDEWAQKHHVTIRVVPYDHGPKERGQILVFNRGPGWQPPAKLPKT
jgi:hypothetical protein